jgi:molybdate transport system substrate-binding protein
LTVFAAASLTEAFTDIGHSFEAEHPEVTVSFQFDGSSTLAHQILEGAPADVFAAADQATMRAVTSQNAVDEATVFALNDLVVAVPADNPARIDSLDDLSGPSVTTLTCTPETPCGAIANRVLSIADLTLTPSSLEPNVAAVASKLRMGEADAGFVYATDVRVSGGELTQIDWPDDQAIRHAAATECPVGVVRGSQHLDLARHFIEFVQSPRGTTALAQAGFRQP